MLAQCWYNIDMMLVQLKHNVGTTFTQFCTDIHTQHCWNIVKCLQINVVTMLGSNIATIFAQHCSNIVTTLMCYLGYCQFGSTDSGVHNTTFVTSITLKIKVTALKHIGFLSDLWGSYIPGFNLIAVKLFELSRGTRCLLMDKWMARQMDSAIT